MMNDQPLPRWVAPGRAPLGVLLVAQLMAGFALGAGTAYLGSVLAGLVVPADPSGGFRDSVVMIVGVLISYPIGVAGGVWLVGRLLGRRGRLWATVLGAYGGVGVVLLIARLLVTGDFAIGWFLIIVLGLVGSCAGYYLSGRRNGA